MSDVKSRLCSRFHMKDMGCVSNFLGVRFTKIVDGLRLDQTEYINNILRRFGMSDCKPRATPCEPNVDKLCMQNSEPDNSGLYRAIVGSLIYLMVVTRPDISYIVTKLSQYLERPTTVHMTLAKSVLRYLKGSNDYCLTYRRSDEGMKLFGYCDADWANDGDRRSITGYCFKLSPNSSPISWKSRKQQSIALSTCEAEYMAMAECVKEAMFLFNMFSKTMYCANDTECVAIHCDNQGAISLAKNQILSQRSKHIDIRYHYIRSIINSGQVMLEYVSSESNLADLFTKSLCKVRLKYLLNLLFT